MNNVDPNEIAKFAEISEKWWDPNGPFAPLHEINPLRVDFMCQHTDFAGKTVLDIGCGGGLLAEAMAKLGAKVTAIDMDQNTIECAKAHASGTYEIDYRHCPVESLDNISFDIITCLEMLEHVPCPQSIIDSIAKLAKPETDIFLSTINRHPMAYVQAILGAEYMLKLLPKGTHDYSKFIKPSELREYANKASLDFMSLKGMTYNPLTKQYSLCDSVKVNYLVYLQPQAQK